MKLYIAGRTSWYNSDYYTGLELDEDYMPVYFPAGNWSFLGAL